MYWFRYVIAHTCNVDGEHFCDLTLYLIETPFNAVANRAEKDQGLLCLRMVI